VALSGTLTANPGAVDRNWSAAVGGVSTAATLIVAVATFESSVPSFVLYVKVSSPLKPGFGVYVTLAVSVLGVPAVQGASVIEERLPFAGPLTTEKVSSQFSASPPLRVTGTAEAGGAVAEVASAVGAVSRSGEMSEFHQ
jgi:hypothetical protein